MIFFHLIEKKIPNPNDFVQVYHDYTSVLETMKQSQQEIKKIKVIKRDLLKLFSIFLICTFEISLKV